MKKLILVPLLLSFLLGMAQKSDSLILESMYREVGKLYVEGNIDGSLLLLDSLTNRSIAVKNHVMHVRALMGLTNIFRQLNKYDESLSNALKLEQVAGVSLNKDDALFLEIYNILAVLYHERKEFNKRDSLTKASTTWYKTYGEPTIHLPTYTTILINMGTSALDAGDYYKAIEFNSQALEMIPDSLVQNQYYINLIKKIYENNGTAYVGLQTYGKAISNFERSILSASSGTINDQAYINTVNRRMAFAYLRNQQPDKAINLCLEVLAKQTAYKSVQRKEYDVSSIYHILGQCYTQIDAFTKAYKNLTRAIKLRKSYEAQYKGRTKYTSIGNSIFRLAEMHHKKGEREKALSLTQKALIQYCISFQDTLPANNPVLEDLKVSAYYLAEILRLKAKLQVEIGEKENNLQIQESSLKTYSLLYDLIERDRKNYKSDESKIFLLAQSKPSLEGGIRVAYTLYKKTQDIKFAERAFQFAERGKSALFLSDMKNVEASYSNILPDTIKQYENALEDQLYNLEEKYYQLSSKKLKQDSILNVLKESIFQIKLDIDELNDRIASSYPKYFEIKNSSINLSLDEVQRSLKQSKKQLLEFFVGEENIFIFHITEDNLFLESIEKSQHFEKTLAYVLDDLQGVTNLSINDLQKGLRDLFKTLLSKTDITIGPASLIIIPDGLLGYLPFELLIAENNSTYLIEDFTISYAYSAKLLYKSPNDKFREVETVKDFIGFAPQYEGAEYLAFNEAEVVEIQKLFLGEARLGNLASEEAFLIEAPEYSIIHLAMHGYLDLDNPAFSYLSFAKDTTQGQDGKLYTYQIYNQSLNTDLVVLSACNTGYGPIVQGEGIMSLARGFRFAGSDNVVMNLWKSDGATSKEIMKDFYAFIKDGADKDQALREAKLTYLKTAPPNKKHPRFWASLVIIGKASSLKQSYMLAWAFLLILLISLGIFLVTRKNV